MTKKQLIKYLKETESHHGLNFSLENIDGEIWIQMPEYVGIYEISNMGRIKRLAKVIGRNNHLKECIGTQKIGSSGYLEISLFNRNYLVHRLIKKAFGKRFYKNKQVNHLNSCKIDNRNINLEWATPKSNMKHAIEQGLHNGKGELNVMAKFTNDIVLKIYIDTRSYKELSIEYKTSEKWISRIKTGARWGEITGAKYIQKINYLTKDKVLEIYKSDKSAKELATQFNTCSATINNIKSGRSWGKLTKSQ